MKHRPKHPRPATFSADNHRQLLSVLEAVRTKTHSSAVVLAETSGVAIAHAGALKTEAVTMLTALAAGNFSASQELARLIGEEAFASHFLEGKKRSMYFAAVDARHFLFVLYANQTTFGLVRVSVEEILPQVVSILHSANAADSSDSGKFHNGVRSADFEAELSAQLDSVLRAKVDARQN